MILNKEVFAWIVITTIGEDICEEPFFPITGLGGGIILVLISYQSELKIKRKMSKCLLRKRELLPRSRVTAQVKAWLTIRWNIIIFQIKKEINQFLTILKYVSKRMIFCHYKCQQHRQCSAVLSEDAEIKRWLCYHKC